MSESMNHYASDVPWTLPPFASEDTLRAFIRAEVRQVLEDDAREIRENNAFQPVSTHRHRRVRQFDETGKEWRGVLYPVDKDSDL